MNSRESPRITSSRNRTGVNSGSSIRDGKGLGGVSIKKKKKGSRRRKDNEIYKATDTSINAQRQLRVLVFQKDSNIIKSPRTMEAPRLPLAEGQFDNAPEVADLAQLRQFHSSNAGGLAHPPFGFFSLHPSTLSLHPLSAVHLYYPSSPLMTNINSNSTQSGLGQNSLNCLGLGSLRQAAFGTHSAAGVAAAASGLGASASALSSFHNPRLLNQHRLQQQPSLSSSSSGTTHQQLAQNHIGIPVIAAQQQLQKAQAAAVAAATASAGQPSFMEYAAAVKRQQQLEFTLQQEVARSEEHFKALHENQKAAMRQHLNGVITPAAIIARQSQQAQSQAQVAHPQHLQSREQLQLEQQQQQKHHAAAVMASLNQQQIAPSSSVQPLTARARNVSGASGDRAAAAAAATSEPARAGPMSAMMALAMASESSNRAVAAAALLRQYASPDDRQKQQRPGTMPGMSGGLKHLQPRPSTQAAAVADDLVPQMASDSPLEQQQQLEQLKPPTLFAVASQGSSIQQDDGSTVGSKSRKPITTTDPSPLTTGMDQLETLPMRAYTPPDTDKKYPVRESEITDCDVLLGRGGMTNHHVGNMHFRTLVAEFRMHYCTAKKGDKGRLSKRLTNFVRFKKGRFLQKDDVDHLWYEVGDPRAHGKCAQALREGTADLMRQVSGVDGGAFPDGEISGSGKGRPSSALTTSSEGSSGRTATMNAYSNDGEGEKNVDMVPRGGVVGGASRGMQHAAAGVTQVSPRCVIVRDQSDGNRRQRDGDGSGRATSPKRPHSPKKPKNVDGRKCSQEGVSGGSCPAVIVNVGGDEHIVAAISDAQGRSEISDGLSDDDSAVEVEHEEDPHRKRVKVDDEGPEQDYDYM